MPNSQFENGFYHIEPRHSSIECLPLTMSFDWLNRTSVVVDKDIEPPWCTVGVAYVKYEKASSAALAVENLHEVTLNNGSGPRLKVMLAESPSARYAYYFMISTIACMFQQKLNLYRFNPVQFAEILHVSLSFLALVSIGFHRSHMWIQIIAHQDRDSLSSFQKMQMDCK